MRSICIARYRPEESNNSEPSSSDPARPPRDLQASRPGNDHLLDPTLHGGIGFGSSSTTAQGEALLSRLRSETQQKLQMQQQLLDVQQQSLENLLKVDSMALEVEGLRHDRALLHERSERLSDTLHMLEARNLKLVNEAAALEDCMAGMASARDVLLRERESLAAALEQQKKEGSLSSAQAAELQARLRALEGELKQQQGAAEAAQRAQEELAGKLESTVQELAGARGERDSAMQQMAALQEELLQGQLQLQQVEQQLQQMRDKATVPANVLSARSWIANWKATQVRTLQEEVHQLRDERMQLVPKTAAQEQELQELREQLVRARAQAEGAAVPENVAAARAWIENWKSKKAPFHVEVPENVASARAWIANWKAKQAAVTSHERTSTEALMQELAMSKAELEGLRQQAAASAEELDLQLHRVTADRNIIASNMASTVKQALAMMAERDAAAGQLQAVQEARKQQQLQQQEMQAKSDAQVEALQRGLEASQAAAAAAEAARKVAELARKEAEAARDAMAVQLENRERELTEQAKALAHQLEVSERMLNLRTQAAVAVRRGWAPGEAPNVAFANSNKYWVPEHLVFDFVKVLSAREVAMQAAEGFIGMVVRQPAAGVYEVSSQWESIPQWEAWSLSMAARKHQVPAGVMQYVPKKGEGFPEDYVPFKDLSEPVNPKY